MRTDLKISTLSLSGTETFQREGYYEAARRRRASLEAVAEPLQNGATAPDEPSAAQGKQAGLPETDPAKSPLGDEEPESARPPPRTP